MNRQIPSRRAVVVGGSGFIGRALVKRLADAGWEVVVPTRRPVRCGDLRLLPQVRLAEADVHDPAQLAALFDGCSLAVNLVGILRDAAGCPRGQPYGPGFERAHVRLPDTIARTAVKAGVSRLLHVSALGAATDAPSAYLRSKADGEARVLAVAPDLSVTVFRPSVVFGAGDTFLNLFARLLRLAPVVPLACPEARFQPVWVGDVVAAMMAALDHPESAGACLPLGGPRTYRLRELVALAGRMSGHPRPIWGLPDSLSYLQAWAMEWIPGGPMTRDNYASMQVPNVCGEAPPLPFGMVPTALEAVAPGYLGSDTFRQQHAGRCRRARR